LHTRSFFCYRSSGMDASMSPDRPFSSARIASPRTSATSGRRGWDELVVQQYGTHQSTLLLAIAARQFERTVPFAAVRSGPQPRRNSPADLTPVFALVDLASCRQTPCPLAVVLHQLNIQWVIVSRQGATTGPVPSFPGRRCSAWPRVPLPDVSVAFPPGSWRIDRTHYCESA